MSNNILLVYSASAVRPRVLLSFLNIRERLLVSPQRRNDRYPLEKKMPHM